MSKEKILQKLEIQSQGDYFGRDVLAAMDEYGKQESVAFAEWFVSDENSYQKQYSSDDDNDGMWHDEFSEGISRHYFTTGQLYNKFKQQQ